MKKSTEKLTSTFSRSDDVPIYEQTIKVNSKYTAPLYEDKHHINHDPHDLSAHQNFNNSIGSCNTTSLVYESVNAYVEDSLEKFPDGNIDSISKQTVSPTISNKSNDNQQLYDVTSNKAIEHNTTNGLSDEDRNSSFNDLQENEVGLNNFVSKSCTEEYEKNKPVNETVLSQVSSITSEILSDHILQTDPEKLIKPSPEIHTISTPKVPRRPQKRDPPSVPKKPSSKIAAFQEMLQKQQLKDVQVSNKNISNTPIFQNKFDSNRTTFAQNLNGLLVLPGGSQIPPTMSSIKNSQESPLAMEEICKSKVASSLILSQKKNKGPKGRKLPSNLIKVEKVDVETFPNHIQVFNNWSVVIKSNTTQKVLDDTENLTHSPEPTKLSSKYLNEIPSESNNSFLTLSDSDLKLSNQFESDALVNTFIQKSDSIPEFTQYPVDIINPSD